MKKILMMLVLFIALLTMVVPVWAEDILVNPGDGGGGVDMTQSDGKLPVTYITPGYSSSSNTTTTTLTTTTGSIVIVVDGTQVFPDIAPFIDNANRVQAPYRAIAEALGCKVGWDEKSQTVSCTKERFEVKMVIGQKQFTVNGAAKTMDTLPVIKNARTFIPVRALSEALNSDVKWDEPSQTVTVTSR